MVNLRYTILGLAIPAAISVGGIWWMFDSDEKREKYCFGEPAVPKTYTIERRSIDQVFRDHDGYRLISSDENSIVREEEFYNSGTWSWNRMVGTKPLLPSENPFQHLSEDKRVVIVKDLSEDKKPFANILRYSMQNCGIPLTHIEVHLPRNRGLAAGIDSYIEGKVEKHEPMHEIR